MKQEIEKPEHIVPSKSEGQGMEPAVNPPGECWENRVMEFAHLILHGDSEHRSWLGEAALAYVQNKPLPPPRDLRRNKWIPTSERLPEVCKPVIGYADKWVDAEYNEMGIRECFHSDDEWQSAAWNNYQDCWDVEVGAPDYWMFVEAPSQVQKPNEEHLAPLVKPESPWIATTTKPPTKEDGDVDGDVYTGAPNNHTLGIINYKDVKKKEWPYWMKIPELPNK